MPENVVYVWGPDINDSIVSMTVFAGGSIQKIGRGPAETVSAAVKNYRNEGFRIVLDTTPERVPMRINPEYRSLFDGK